MHIHTDTLTMSDLHMALHDLDGVYVDTTRHGSRSRNRKFNVHLTAEKRDGQRWRNTGNHGAAQGDAAATWDEWGIFLARLFDIDPNAHCWAYESAEHFHWATAARFANGGPEARHNQHRFVYAPVGAGLAYIESHCKCGAVRRVMTYGYSYSELATA